MIEIQYKVCKHTIFEHADSENTRRIKYIYNQQYKQNCQYSLIMHNFQYSGFFFLYRNTLLLYMHI